MEKYPPTKIWFIGKQKTDKKVSISPKFPRLLPRHLLVTDCHRIKTMDRSCFWEAPQYFNLRLPCWALSNPSNIRRGAKVSCKLPILIWRGIDGWTLGLARTQNTLLILAYLLIPVSLSLPWLQLLWPALQQAVFPLYPIFTEACSTHYLWEWSSQFSQIIATIRSKLFQRIKIDTSNTFPFRMGIVMLPACKM